MIVRICRSLGSAILVGSILAGCAKPHSLVGKWAYQGFPKWTSTITFSRDGSYVLTTHMHAPEFDDVGSGTYSIEGSTLTTNQKAFARTKNGVTTTSLEPHSVREEITWVDPNRLILRVQGDKGNTLVRTQ